MKQFTCSVLMAASFAMSSTNALAWNSKKCDGPFLEPIPPAVLFVNPDERCPDELEGNYQPQRCVESTSTSSRCRIRTTIGGAPVYRVIEHGIVTTPDGLKKACNPSTRISGRVGYPVSFLYCDTGAK